jgi:HD domain
MGSTSGAAMETAVAQAYQALAKLVPTKKFAGASKELWIVLSVFAIAAVLNSLIDVHRMVLGFYTLPTLYSAYTYGRRHATLTAFFSVFLVVMLTAFNPTLFSHQFSGLEGEGKWFDLTVWGGILVVTAYFMGTLYERNQQNLTELRESYHGILLILQHFASNDKYSQDHAYRVSICATRICENLGLDSDRTEDVRAAALLHNIDALGISTDVLFKAARMTEHDTPRKNEKAMGGSLRRVIPVVMAHQRIGNGEVEAASSELPLEARILAVADTYETLTSGHARDKAMSPTQAEEVIVGGSGTQFDSRVVDAFVKAFAHRVMAKGAGDAK